MYIARARAVLQSRLSRLEISNRRFHSGCIGVAPKCINYKPLPTHIVFEGAALSMGSKYYAVRVGRRPGIYRDWNEVRPLVEGFSGAQFKSFNSWDAADMFMSDGPTATVGVKRNRYDSQYDDDDDDPYYQNAASNKRSQTGYAAPSHPAHRSAPLANYNTYTQPTIGYAVVERRPPASSAPYAAPAQQTRNYSNLPAPAPSRPTFNSSDGGSSNSNRAFEAVVEGPFQPIRSDLVYQLEFDGAARGNPGKAGCGALLRRRDTGAVVCKLRKYMGTHSTNNEAEYTALLEGLKLARRLGVTRVHAQGDSKLVVMQVTGRWQINKDHLRVLCRQVQDEARGLADFQLRHVLRDQNGDADQLSNDAIDLAYRY